MKKALQSCSIYFPGLNFLYITDSATTKAHQFAQSHEILTGIDQLHLSLTSMASSPFRPFRLALIQLGSIGPNKLDNLNHARDMILKAARNQEAAKRPDVIVLPVRDPHPGGQLHLA